MRWLLRHIADHGREVHVVRRVEMRCPHTGECTEIALLMGSTGRPSMVLRCNRRPEAPPTCDQLCRMRAEAVTTAPRSLVLVPSGDERLV